MNLGEIEESIYDQLNFNTTPDSAVVRRIRRHINLGHRQILSKRGFGILRRQVLTAASVANSPFMVLPQAATKINIIADRVRNRNLDVISVADIRYRDPGLTLGTIPDSYAKINLSAPVAQQPSAADSLFVISDSASDGSGVAVNIEGIVTGGYYRKASVAMNGTTAVNVSATISTWVLVTKFFITGNAAGNVTLHQTSGVGTELGRIVRGQAYARYSLVHLSPTPAQSDTYYCDVDLHVSDMLSAMDEPMLPEDFHQLLIFAALKREYLKREKMGEYGAEEKNWKAMIDDLADHVRSKGGVGRGGQRGDNRRDPQQFASTSGVIW